MKIIKLIITILFISLLSGCFGREPDDTAYIAALGIDSAKDGRYNITIQFAHPVQISGGGSEEGGKGGEEIVENISVEAPDIYSAISAANHLISKRFSLSHAKIVVFSKEVAQKGIKEIMETLNRSDEVRPNIITAVSRETAQSYLENTKPIVEVNPTKYYQLIYEKNNSGGIPKMTGIEAMFDIIGGQRDIVMPLAGVAKSDGKSDSGSESGSDGSGSSGGESDSGGSGSSGGESDSGESGSSGESGAGGQSGSQKQSSNQGADSKYQQRQDAQLPLNEQGFQYKHRNYKAGQVKLIDEDKSEALGMAVFKGDKLVGEFGEIDADIYNILIGRYKENYTSFKTPLSPQKAVTVMLNQRRRPVYKIDKNKKTLEINLYMEGDFYSLPYDYNLESDVSDFEKGSAEEISRQCCDFIKKMRDEYDTDILGIGEKAKRMFIDLNAYESYNWKEKFKEYNIEVKTKLKIRHSGITYRE